MHKSVERHHRDRSTAPSGWADAWCRPGTAAAEPGGCSPETALLSATWRDRPAIAHGDATNFAALPRIHTRLMVVFEVPVAENQSVADLADMAVGNGPQPLGMSDQVRRSTVGEGEAVLRLRAVLVLHQCLAGRGGKPTTTADSHCHRRSGAAQRATGNDPDWLGSETEGLWLATIAQLGPGQQAWPEVTDPSS